MFINNSIIIPAQKFDSDFINNYSYTRVMFWHDNIIELNHQVPYGMILLSVNQKLFTLNNIIVNLEFL